MSVPVPAVVSSRSTQVYHSLCPRRRNAGVVFLAGKPTLQKVRADQGDMCQSCYGARRCNFCQMDQRQDKNAVLAKCKKTTCNDLALWCATCNSSEALALQQCQECLPKRMQKVEVTMAPKKKCWSCMLAGKPTLQKTRTDQGDLCQACYGARRCNICQMERRQDKTEVLPKCSKPTCNHLALWCAGCHSPEVLALQRCNDCLPKSMRQVEQPQYAKPCGRFS